MVGKPIPVEVAPRPGYRLWLRYDDGTEGEVDLSDMVGKGVFEAWKDPAVFEDVKIGPHGQIGWGEEIDICPDALYLELTGKTPEELFPRLRTVSVA
jgi:hypothetical protein